MESTRLISFSCTGGMEHLLQGQADTMDQVAPSEAGTLEDRDKISPKWRFGALFDISFSVAVALSVIERAPSLTERAPLLSLSPPAGKLTECTVSDRPIALRHPDRAQSVLRQHAPSVAAVASSKRCIVCAALAVAKHPLSMPLLRFLHSLRCSGHRDAVSPP